MKLLGLTLKSNKRSRYSTRRGEYSDYYQNRLNSFGREQMETLVRKGITLSW